ncbi:MAG: ATP-grasp domain-containing protein [Oscillibacter sp.]|nr:ATP-grasp domain-containing protein [Oscillibacter sp.]MBQ2996327.1 ATP-grasp domain-containing protein [Oscillibacter sp.]
MNFIFLSPNFPKTYWHFTQGLKSNGVTTLGIGDCPYDELDAECRNSLVEYYKVSSMENYDEVYRAVAFFAFKYGKIDWLETNNEYWLLRDAQLRTDFNITTGLQNDRIDGIKYKSRMKEFYAKAGVKTARYHLVTNMEEGLAFIAEVGYPVIVKPDNGVGAAATYKLKNEEDVKSFYADLPSVQYIMEEFINGTIVSYDGICDSNRDIIFETSHYFPDPVMDIVNDHLDLWYYSRKEIPADLKDAGRRTIKAFESNSRFFHCEFFVLNEDKEGLGKKGDIFGLEVNMRPPGGYSPDMMNYANDIDVYQIWADMVCFDKGRFDPEHRPYCCVYASRRRDNSYLHSHEEIYAAYGSNILMYEEMPEVLSGAMGNFAYIARFPSEEEALAYADYVLKKG